jgi:hypothetical protein
MCHPDLQKIIETRGKLDAQYSENESVEKVEPFITRASA